MKKLIKWQMEWNKIKKYIFLLCLCLLTGCTGTSKEEQNVHNWIPYSEDSTLKAGEYDKDALRKSMEDDEWLLCVNDEAIVVKENQLLYDEENLYCKLALFDDFGIIRQGFFPTYYVDDNGLRCIGVEFELKSDTSGCIVRKYYALLDKTLLCLEDEMDVTEQQKHADDMLSIEFLCDNTGWEYDIDKEKKEIQVLGDFSEKESTFYELIVPKVVSNRVWLTDGTCAEAEGLWGEEYRNSFASTPSDAPIEVKEGERIIMDCYFSWFPEVATILFLDDTGEVVKYYNSSSSVNVENTIIVVPQGATKMHISFYANQQYSIKKEKKMITFEPEGAAQEEYEQIRLNVMKKNAQNSRKNEHILFDKGYVSFVLDDCRPDMDVIASIFAEYDIPLCVAAVWENMYSPGSLGEYTRMEICQQVVQNGGEILAHDAEVLTEEKMLDSSIMEKHFVLDKYYLEQAGFEVNGIILAGGTGYVIGSEASDLWSRTFYLYSDLYGKESSGEPYYHRRFWLGGCLDNYEQVISEAIANKEWVSFYFHDLKEVDEKALREILEYVVSVSDDLEAVNYKTVYSNIYGAEVWND